MELLEVRYFKYSRGLSVGDVSEQLPAGRRGGVGPAPVDHARCARRKWRHARQEYRRVVDRLRLRDCYDKRRLCQWRKVCLYLKISQKIFLSGNINFI